MILNDEENDFSTAPAATRSGSGRGLTLRGSLSRHRKAQPANGMGKLIYRSGQRGRRRHRERLAAARAGSAPRRQRHGRNAPRSAAPSDGRYPAAAPVEAATGQSVSGAGAWAFAR